MHASLQKRIEKLLDTQIHAANRVHGGYTPTARWVVRMEKQVFFVKVATTPVTADMVRREMNAYQAIRGPFMPDLIAWEDHEEEPLLIIEDLSAARWPPPWDDRLVNQALDQIARMHATKADLPAFGELHPNHDHNWSRIAEDPTPFLSLGWVDKAWLFQALPILLGAEAACQTAGKAVTHFDIRSDNMCQTTGGVKLVDWPEACLSNPNLDLGFWLPSLAFEGGPPPETILPDAPEVAAWVAGFFAARAGLPGIPDAPRVRLVQQQQLQTALPWAVRALGLPEIGAI